VLVAVLEPAFAGLTEVGEEIADRLVLIVL
jgi:hypothetical protein